MLQVQLQQGTERSIGWLQSCCKFYSFVGDWQVCVICMENLANLVVMPCKHLALCSPRSELESLFTWKQQSKKTTQNKDVIWCDTMFFLSFCIICLSFKAMSVEYFEYNLREDGSWGSAVWEILWNVQSVPWRVSPARQLDATYPGEGSHALGVANLHQLKCKLHQVTSSYSEVLKELEIERERKRMGERETNRESEESEERERERNREVWVSRFHVILKRLADDEVGPKSPTRCRFSHPEALHTREKIASSHEYSMYCFVQTYIYIYTVYTICIYRFLYK